MDFRNVHVYSENVQKWHQQVLARSNTVPLPLCRFLQGFCILGLNSAVDTRMSARLWTQTNPCQRRLKPCVHMAPSFRAFTHPGNYSLNLDAENASRKKKEHPVGINGDWGMEQWGKESAWGKTKNERQNQLGGMQRPFPRLMASTNRIGPEGFPGLQLTVKAVQSLIHHKVWMWCIHTAPAKAGWVGVNNSRSPEMRAI